MRKLLVISLLFLMTAMVACKGGDSEAPGESPAPLEPEAPKGFSMDSPPIETEQEVKLKRIVEVPDEISEKWVAIKLEVTKKESGDKEEYEIKIGEEITVKGTDLKIKVAAFLPNFTMGEGVMTSIDAKPENPAAHLIISEVGNEIWDGIIFAQFPDTHTFDHEKYRVKLSDYIAAKGSGIVKEPETKEEGNGE